MLSSINGPYGARRLSNNRTVWNFIFGFQQNHFLLIVQYAKNQHFAFKTSYFLWWKIEYGQYLSAHQVILRILGRDLSATCFLAKRTEIDFQFVCWFPSIWERLCMHNRSNSNIKRLKILKRCIIHCAKIRFGSIV